MRLHARTSQAWRCTAIGSTYEVARCPSISCERRAHAPPIVVKFTIEGEGHEPDVGRVGHFVANACDGGRCNDRSVDEQRWDHARWMRTWTKGARRRWRRLQTRPRGMKWWKHREPNAPAMPNVRVPRVHIMKRMDEACEGRKSVDACWTHRPLLPSGCGRWKLLPPTSRV